MKSIRRLIAEMKQRPIPQKPAAWKSDPTARKEFFSIGDQLFGRYKAVNLAIERGENVSADDMAYIAAVEKRWLAFQSKYYEGDRK